MLRLSQLRRFPFCYVVDVDARCGAGMLVAAWRQDFSSCGNDKKPSGPHTKASACDGESVRSRGHATSKHDASLAHGQVQETSSPRTHLSTVCGQRLISWTRVDCSDTETPAVRQEYTGQELVDVLGCSALMGPLASLPSSRLLDVLKFVVYKAGDVIVFQGHKRMNAMHFFFDGKAHAEKKSLRDGSTKTIRRFEAQSRQCMAPKDDDTGSGEDEDSHCVLPRRPGTENLWRYEAVDYFGEFALWKNEPVSCSIVCDTDCKVVKIEREMLESLDVFEDMVEQLHIIASCLHDSRLRQQFESFDGNSDGLLTVEEAWCMMSRLGCSYSWQDFQQGFAKLESAWQDALSYDDFFRFWATCNFDDPLDMRAPRRCAADKIKQEGADLLREDSQEVNQAAPAPNVSHESAQSPRCSPLAAGRGTLDGAVEIGQGESGMEQLETLISQFQSLTQTVCGESIAVRSEKLATLEALVLENLEDRHEQMFSSSEAGGASFLESLLLIVGDAKQGEEVRLGAARVLQALVQRCPGAAYTLLAAGFGQHADISGDSPPGSLARGSFIQRGTGRCSEKARVAVFPAFEKVGRRKRSPTPVAVVPTASPTPARNLSSTVAALGACWHQKVKSRSQDKLSRSHSPLRLCVGHQRGARGRSRSPTATRRARRARSMDRLQDARWSYDSKARKRYLSPALEPDSHLAHAAACQKLDRFLGSVAHFRHLDAGQRQQLGGLVQVKLFVRDDIICRKGERGRTSFFLMYVGMCVTTEGGQGAGEDATQIVSGASCAREPGRDDGDVLSSHGAGPRLILPGQVFGWESVEGAHQSNRIVEEDRTCVAATRLCSVLAIPYEAYIRVLHGDGDRGQGQGRRGRHYDGDVEEDGCLAETSRRCTGIITEHHRAFRMQSTFRKADSDGDGLLDARDMAALCALIGFKCDLELSRQICVAITRRPDHLVCFGAFSDW